MITKRIGVFETNSSSVHAVCISDKDPEKLPEHIRFVYGEYDNIREDLKSTTSRASYLLELILFGGIDKIDDRLDMLREWLDTLGVKYHFPEEIEEDNIYAALDEGYIGHGAVADITDALMRDKDLLKRFLFSKDSLVQIGADWDDYYMDEQLMYEDKENPGFMVFNKWN